MASEKPDDAVATYLRQRLDEMGITSAALARELGVSKNTVTNWTKGKHRPHRKHAEAMAVALATSPEAFLSGPEDRPPHPEAQPDGGEEKAPAEVPAQADGGEEKPPAEVPAQADGGEEKPPAEVPAQAEGGEEKPSGEAAGKKRNAEGSDRRPSRGTTGAGSALVA